MKKTIIAIIIGIVLVLLAGVTVWILTATRPPVEQQTTQNLVDKTNSSEVSVDIRDLSFTPSTILIKKGTKVTWTNQDSVGHNVVADGDAPDTGGLPLSAPLFGHGQTASVTFTRVGTFNYHCMSHTFMRGSVHVID